MYSVIQKGAQNKMTVKRVEPRIWNRLKFNVMTRDDYICQICLERLEDDINIHHIIPKSKQGLDCMNNLICVCRPCHILIELSNGSNILRGKLKDKIKKK